MTAPRTELAPPASGLDGLLTQLKAAAEPSRLRILVLLAEGELTVSELVDVLGQSQPRVSRHLRVLAEAGLVTRHREGSWVFHRLADAGTGAQVARQLNALLPADGDDGLGRDQERLAAVKHQRWEEAARYFQRNAESWDSVRSLHIDDRQVEDAIGRLLPGTGIGRLLDIGTGTGRMLEILAPRIGSGIGIDQSREMLAVARANLEKAGADNCQVRLANMFQLPFQDGAFDAATIHQVLHFVDDPGAAIVEAARVLTPGGLLLVADFAPHALESLRTEHEHRRLGFADDEIAAWFAAARLGAKATVHLAGSPLTVVLWLAEKPGGTRAASPKQRASSKKDA